MIDRDTNPEAPLSPEQAEQIAGLLETVITLKNKPGKLANNLLFFGEDYGDFPTIPPEVTDFYPEPKLATVENQSYGVTRRFDRFGLGDGRPPLQSGELGAIVFMQKEVDSDGQRLESGTRFAVINNDGRYDVKRELIGKDPEPEGRETDMVYGRSGAEIIAAVEAFRKQHDEQVAADNLEEKLGLNSATAIEAENLITFLSRFDTLAEPAA